MNTGWDLDVFIFLFADKGGSFNFFLCVKLFLGTNVLKVCSALLVFKRGESHCVLISVDERWTSVLPCNYKEIYSKTVFVQNSLCH